VPHSLKPTTCRLGIRSGAVINGRWERLSIAGIALSPEYVYAIADAAALVPDNRRFGVLWMHQKALATAFQMDGAFNDLALTLTPDAREAAVKAQVDWLLAPYGGLGTYDRSSQVSHRILSDELAQQCANDTIIPTSPWVWPPFSYMGCYRVWCRPNASISPCSRPLVIRTGRLLGIILNMR